MTREEHIEAITSALGRLEAALGAREGDEVALPRLEIMIETLKAQRAKLVAELKPQMH